MKKYFPYNFFDDDDSQGLYRSLNPSAVLPKRNQLKSFIENHFEKKQKIIMSIWHSNLSKISFTLDGRTSIANQSYYGITRHFIDDYWILNSLAIDSYPSHGELTVKDIANCFYQIVIHYKIEEKIMGITVDNVYANKKCIVELRALLHTFASENQHFRCVAHISNPAVQDMLKI